MDAETELQTLRNLVATLKLGLRVLHMTSHEPTRDETIADMMTVIHAVELDRGKTFDK